ncbi:MAG: glycoside hydrolase family 3 N-terminal domain-containing protein [Clostridia bacterium]|nr:glycoside hydrolase family 3 N-terminal domain-containing protein [Clostridia bacterium]
MLPYENPALAPARRAEDLCSRLTLREKVGQLCQRLYGFESYVRRGDNLALSDSFCQEVQRFGGLGTLYGLYRADPWSGRNFETGLDGALAPRAYNMAQRYVMEHSRFHIPMLLSSECPHGHQALSGYLLPINLAAGATFDPELLRRAGEICGRQLRGMGVNLALVSVLDVLRDPRWGRGEECYGEDPLLASRFARAIVEGIQSQGPAVVAKHLLAQGETTGGVNASAARIGERELREIHLPAAKAACEAGARGFMAAYNEVDGIPCHANEALLTGLLREEWGFDGVVMADGCAIDRLNAITGDAVRSGALALSSGVDIGLWDEGFARLEEAAAQGLVREEDIDRAVTRVLTLKFEQGLFEHPFLPETAPERFSLSDYPQGFELSKESLVLLKNDGVLPLQKGCRVALIGPAADELYRQLGDYSPPVRPGEAYTLLGGLRAVCDRGIAHCDGSDLAEARRLAASCEVAVLALGGSSSRFAHARFDKNGAALSPEGSMDCGEGVDSARLALPGGQLALYEAVRAAAARVAVVLVAGRPYAIPEIAETCDALLAAFYPGPWGGLAIAQALTGGFSPCGRLPVSFPKHAGQLPVCYNEKSGVVPLGYCEASMRAPLFAFGEGFGYSTIAFSGFSLDQTPYDGGPSGETVLTLRMTLSNTGPMDDAAVPQLYVSRLTGDTVPRVMELKAFAKRRLVRGESACISLTLTADDLSVYDRRMRFVYRHDRVLLRLCDSGRELWRREVQL